MRALVIDTSSAAITAGVVELSDGGTEVVSEQVTVNGRAHGELLTPSIRAALAQAGSAVAELRAVIAGVGPGPFTGLRVGLVTAASLADALAVPSYAVCSLDAIGADHGELGSLLVAADARRKEIYWATYRHGQRVSGPAVDKPADLPGDLAVEAAAGAGAELYAEVLGLPVLAGGFPSVRGLAGLARDRVLAGAAAEPLTPLYLRRPDAVVPGERKPVRAG